jgi:predicted ATPase
MVGFPDRAVERAHRGVALARKLNHPYSQAYALFHTGVLHLWRREAEIAKVFAKDAIDFAEEHEFHVWKAGGTCLHGAALAGIGQAEQALAQMQEGLDLYQGLKTPPVFWPLLMFMQAEINGLAGRSEQGLSLLDNVFENIGPGTEVIFFGEYNRVKGNLLLAISPDKKPEAEASFQRTLELAQQLQLPMQELRAAVGLSRIWQDQGKAGQGRQVLSNAYEKFTEGFTTADLQEAKGLLDSLTVS